jgi:two-component system, chemotaxis family, CheB/CheR fusion protein
MLLSHGGFFIPVELRRRIFQKAPRAHQPDGVRPADSALAGPGGAPAVQDALRDEALLAAPLAQLVVTADGLVALVNRKAERLFGLSARDVGRPFRDLEISYRPLELRRHLEQAQSERRTVRIGDVPLHGGQSPSTLDIEISPLVGGDGDIIGATVAFHDVSAFRRLKDELEQTNRQLETAYEELQSTNEELETTNEELQSTVEELETTNEELQSTNEELETMNEELQSTNDELQTINDELQDRTGELDAANSFLEAILTSLRTGVVVLNLDLHVRVWSRQAQELWGLRPEEAVGQHFLNLDIGLPTEQLRPLIRRTLVGEDGPQEATVAAVNRRGRTIDVRVLSTALPSGTDQAAGVILTMEGMDDKTPAEERTGT